MLYDDLWNADDAMRLRRSVVRGSHHATLSSVWTKIAPACKTIRATKARRGSVRPRIIVAVIVGAAALIVNTIVSGFLGICGPFVSLVAGAIAGFFASRQEQPASQRDGARLGAISGLLVGAFTLVAQMVGALAALVLVQVTGIQLPFGSVPPPGASAPIQATYYLAGTGVAACLGVVGFLVAALGGAGGGYLGTRPRATPDAT
jgi:hypothetical protein